MFSLHVINFYYYRIYGILIYLETFIIKKTFVSFFHYLQFDAIRSFYTDRQDRSISVAKEDTVGKKSIRALEIFRVQKLILNATS